MVSSDLHKLTIAQAGTEIRNRRLSPVELTQAYLDRIDRLNADLGAYITVTGEQALSRAREAESEIQAGRYAGPLHGVPLAVKDIISTRGVLTSAGSRVLADNIPDHDSTIIERLNAGVKEAGGDKRALGALAAWFIDRLFTGILGAEQVRWQMALMLREFHQPSEEFPMLLRERINPLHDAVARLVGAAKGESPKAPETLLLTHALIGQCMVFGMARTVVWARLDWDGYTPERVKRIIATLTPAVLAMLGLPPGEDR